MRITHSQMARTLVDNLYRLQQRRNQAQIDLATGERIHQPSDDPTGASKSMALRHQADELEFYKNSMNDAGDWLKAADSAMTQLTGVLHRVRELIISGTNTDKPPEAMYALAAEAEELLGQAVSVLNTQHNGRYVFGGTAYHIPPITYDNSDPNNPVITWSNQADAITRIISKGERIQINFTADQFSPPGNPTGLLDQLHQVVVDLRTGQHESLGTDRLEELQQSLSRLLSLQSEAGAKLNRIEQNLARTIDLSLNLETLLADVQATDMPRTLIDLSIATAAYETALAIGGRLIPRTLLDFLR